MSRTDVELSSPFVEKRGAAWGPVRVEHYRLRADKLRVMLARTGRLAEAEREFEKALRQSDAPFAEAAHNLKLCRALLAEGAHDGAAALKVAAGADEFSR